jgi:hypothetical protein
VKVLKDADNVAPKRNAYVHGRPLYGTRVGDSKIVARKGVVPGNETDLLKVVDEIKAIQLALGETWEPLYVALDAKRRSV